MKIIIFSNQNLILSVQIIENNEKIFEENIHFEKTSKLTLIKSLFEFTRKNNIIKYIWGNGSIYNLFSFVEKFNQDIFTGIENLSFFNNIEKTLLNHLYNFLNASKEIIEIPLPDIKIKNYDKNFIIPETKEPIIKQDLELKKEDINIDSNISQISNKILSLNKKFPELIEITYSINDLDKKDITFFKNLLKDFLLKINPQDIEKITKIEEILAPNFSLIKPRLNESYNRKFHESMGMYKNEKFKPNSICKLLNLGLMEDDSVIFNAKVEVSL